MGLRVASVGVDRGVPLTTPFVVIECVYVLECVSFSQGKGGAPDSEGCAVLVADVLAGV
jgi:hypothetical protein